MPNSGIARSGWVRFHLLLSLAVTVAPLVAAPTITSVQNAASNIVLGLPNASIAQGSIFIIKGSGLGPATLSMASTPFQSTVLNGTSVAVTSGGTTVNALMYYTSDGQVAALLPSNTPIGLGNFTVTYNGQTSNSVAHGIDVSAPGVFTVDSTGKGPAIVTYSDYSLVSSYKAANCGGPNTTCGAANPGDTLILWATGLGPVKGDDASGAGLGVNMPNLPLKVWLGGLQAPVLYQGRSGCCVGEDQIVFTVPNNVPTGCAVPLVVQLGNIVSNTTPMPVAAGSRSCNFIDPAIAKIDPAQLSGTVPFGSVEIDHLLNDTNTGFQDFAAFNFVAFTMPAALQPFAGTFFANFAVGTCSAKTPGGIQGEIFTHQVPLDGGSKFTIAGPNGSMNVTGNSGDTITLSNTGAFLTPGDYTLSGVGGKDIGPFTAKVNVPVLPTLTSPATPAGFTVSRSQGLTISWTPNNSSTHVEAQIGSFIGNNVGVRVTCTAPVSAGTLTFPDYVLLALPIGNGGQFNFQPGDGPGGAATLSTFSASGLALGLAQAFVDGIGFVGFNITN
ncbi:MAG TPA: hypothetical protein VKX49_12280 [Bryobacteraceae bacterium]|nr:hypothetical protein [Bryobacteraceae bacterium]